jgi:hypothetical protein
MPEHPDHHRPFFLSANSGLRVTIDRTEKNPAKQWDHLPPILRSQAQHTRLPRNRKLPVIGIVFTIALHVVVVGVVYLRSDKAPDRVFFMKLLPLDEKAMPAKTPEPAPPAAAPVQPEPDSGG